MGVRPGGYLLIALVTTTGSALAVMAGLLASLAGRDFEPYPWVLCLLSPFGAMALVFALNLDLKPALPPKGDLPRLLALKRRGGLFVRRNARRPA